MCKSGMILWREYSVLCIIFGVTKEIAWVLKWSKQRYALKLIIPWLVVNLKISLQIILNLLTLINLLINILSSKLFSCIKTFHNKNKNFRFQTQRVPPSIFFCPGMLRTKVGHRSWKLAIDDLSRHCVLSHIWISLFLKP
jgi:hypothetical protein